MNNEREQIRMKLESKERVDRMKNSGEDARATLAEERLQRGNESETELMSRREAELYNRMETSKKDPYGGYGEDQRAMMNSWGKKTSEEEKRKFSEEELKLREETLSRTPSGHDMKYRIVGEMYAPTSQGMKAVGNMPEEHSVYSDQIASKPKSSKARIMDNDDDSSNTRKLSDKTREVGGKSVEGAKNFGNMVENKTREMDEAHIIEHSAHRAGNTIGSIFSRAKVAARELSDGFKEGYSHDKK